MVSPLPSFQQSPAGRRSQPRLRLGLPAVLDMVGGAEKCRLIDLSEGGAAIECEMPHRAGVAGLLLCEELEAFGEIVWSAGRQCGFRFDEPLAESQIIAMRLAAPAVLARRDTSAEDFARNWVAGRI